VLLSAIHPPCSRPSHNQIVEVHKLHSLTIEGVRQIARAVVHHLLVLKDLLEASHKVLVDRIAWANVMENQKCFGRIERRYGIEHGISA
jgi:hypothetical protein